MFARKSARCKWVPSNPFPFTLSTLISSFTMGYEVPPPVPMIILAEITFSPGSAALLRPAAVA